MGDERQNNRCFLPLVVAGVGFSAAAVSWVRSNQANKKADNNNTLLKNFPRRVDESGTSAAYLAGTTGKANKGGSLTVRFSKDGSQPDLSNAAPYTTAVGYEAGGKNLTGQKSTYIGAYSGRDATSGEKNTGLGYKSLYANTKGNNNVGLGYEAGNKFTSGSNNVLIGYTAMKNETGAANNRIVLGGRAANGQTDNRMVLGNSSLENSTVIYGTGLTLIDTKNNKKLDISYDQLKTIGTESSITDANL